MCSEKSLQTVSSFAVELINSANACASSLKPVRSSVVAAGVPFHELVKPTECMLNACTGIYNQVTLNCIMSAEHSVNDNSPGML